MAHSSTGGSEVPAYDRCYILATDIYVIVFRAVCIGIYYAVLIATPEATSDVNRRRNFNCGYISGWQNIRKNKENRM